MTDGSAAVAVNDEAPVAVERPRSAPPKAWRYLEAPERKRLCSELQAARSELALLLAEDASRARQPWAEQAELLLDRADQEARDGDLDAGWKFLHEAQRDSMLGFDADLLAAREIALRAEATDKLGAWRKSAALMMLESDPEKTSLGQRRVKLREATRIRDEHSDNVYFRFRLLRQQMAVVAGVLSGLLLALLATLAVEPKLGDLLRAPDIGFGAALAAMLLGAMAACLSALITFATSSTELRIPAHLAATWVTATRPLIGAVSGLVGLVFVKSGLLNLPVGITPWLAPFLFGFSERIVLGAIGNTQKKE